MSKMQHIQSSELGNKFIIGKIALVIVLVRMDMNGWQLLSFAEKSETVQLIQDLQIPDLQPINVSAFHTCIGMLLMNNVSHTVLEI